MKKAALSFGLVLISATVVAGESLWLSKANTENSIFADRTAGRIGDILTIVVDESSSVSSSVNKSTNKSGSANASISNFFYSGFATANGGEYPNVEYSGPGLSSSGGGNITNAQSVSSSASVLVIDRLPNGNLIIEGARELSVSGETQYVIIRGIVRRDDIDKDNTIISSKIASAHVEFLEKGAIASAQKQGWIAQLLNVANIW